MQLKVVIDNDDECEVIVVLNKYDNDTYNV